MGLFDMPGAPIQSAGLGASAPLAAGPRFTPWTGQMPQMAAQAAPLGDTGLNFMGGSQTFNESTGQYTTPAPSAPRFTPVTGGMPSGARFSGQPTQSGGDAGFDPSQYIGLGLTGLRGGLGALNFANQAGGNFLGSLGNLAPFQQGLGGLQALFGLAQNIRSGNALGAAQDVYGAYNATNSIFDLGGPTFSSALDSLGSALGFGANLGGAGGLAATEAGIGLGAGEALSSGLSAGLGAISTVAAPFVMAATSWMENQAFLDSLESGRTTNPIRGALYSGATAGVQNTQTILDAIAQMGGVEQVPTDTLLRALGPLVNNLQPYYHTGPSGRGVFRASDTVTGGTGPTGNQPYTGDGASPEGYTAKFTSAQDGVLGIIQNLLDRGVSYEQLGQTPISGNWAAQKLDLSNPLQDFYNRSQGNPEIAGLGSELMARLKADNQFVLRTGWGDSFGGPSTPAEIRENALRTTLEPQDIFEGAQGGDRFMPFNDTGAGNVDMMYGGKLWNALARMGVGGPDMQALIQQHFNPYRGVADSSGSTLYNQIMTYLSSNRGDFRPGRPASSYSAYNPDPSFSAP